MIQTWFLRFYFCIAGFSVLCHCWHNLTRTDDLPPAMALYHSMSALQPSNDSEILWSVPAECRVQSSRIDFVISHYSEDLVLLKKAVFRLGTVAYIAHQGKPCFWLLSKGNVRYEQVKELLFDETHYHLAWVKLPNRGREALSMLFYLAVNRHFETFGSHALFMQGGFHASESGYPKGHC